VFFSGWALRRIRNDPALAGRRMALAGLTLSLLMAAAAPSDWLFYRWKVRAEARQFSDLWFRCLTQDEPQKAYQLTVPPAFRQPLNYSLWAYYRNNDKSRMGLENYVKTPLVRTLLAMGPKALVRFYDTAGQTRDNDNDVVELLYAVTYEEEGQKKSFLVMVQSMRTQVSDGTAGWRILQAGGGVQPKK